MSIANFSPEAQTFSLTLTLDGETLAEKTLTLEPAVRRAVVVPFTDPGGGVVRLRLNVSDDLAADNVAYAVLPPQRQIAVTPREPRQPVPREGPQDRPPGQARGEEARRVSGRHGGGRRRHRRLREPHAHRQRALRARQHGPARRAARGARASREPGHHGLGPDAPHHAPARLREGHDRGRHAGAPARRGQDPGGGRGRAARVHARGAGSKSGVLRLRPVQDRFPAARGLPAHALEEPPVAAPGRPRSVEPLAVDGPAHPAPRRARGDHGDRDDPVGPAGQGAGHARGGELRGHGRGRGLHGQHRARRDARGRQPHERRGVRPDAAAAPRLRRGGAAGGAAGAHPARAVAVLRPARPGRCSPSKGCSTGAARRAAGSRCPTGTGIAGRSACDAR